MATVKSTSTTTLDLPDGRSIPPGTTRDRVDLTDPHVSGLLRAGRLVEVPTTDGDGKPPSAAERAAAMKAADSVEQLDRLLVEENARPRPSRKALDAAERRRAELTNPDQEEQP